MSMPVLIIKSAPPELQQGLADASLAGLSPIASALGKAADLMPFDPADLHQFLNFKKGTATQAAARSRWTLGRLYNRLAGENPDYITLGGVHLRQTFAVLDIATPDSVTIHGEYMLRLDHVIRALAVLKNES